MKTALCALALAAGLGLIQSRDAAADWLQGNLLFVDVYPSTGFGSSGRYATICVRRTIDNTYFVVIARDTTFRNFVPAREDDLRSALSVMAASGGASKRVEFINITRDPSYPASSSVYLYHRGTTTRCRFDYR